MSLQAAMFIGVGGQIGSGWLFAVLSAAGIAGPSALISWLIGGALTMLIALAWMEVGTAIPVSGAIVRPPYLSNGGLAGWILGLSYWLANISLPAIEAVASLTYLGGIFPQLGLLTTRDGVSMLSWPRGILLGVALMLVFLAINLFGVKLLSEANRWVTWWKIIIPVATFLLLFLTFDGDDLTSYGFFGDQQHGGPGAMLEAVAVSGIAFALMGFRGVIDFGGEVKRPSRNIPLGTVGCVVIPLAVYLGLQLAFLGAIDWADAGVAPGDWVGLANSPWAEGPLAAALHASGYAMLGAFVSVLLLDAILSPGAAGYIYLGSGARVGYRLAVNKFFPQIMARVNRHGVPAVSAIVSFAIGCLFFLPELVPARRLHQLRPGAQHARRIRRTRRDAPDRTVAPAPLPPPRRRHPLPRGFRRGHADHLLVRLRHAVQPGHGPARRYGGLRRLLLLPARVDPPRPGAGPVRGFPRLLGVRDRSQRIPPGPIGHHDPRRLVAGTAPARDGSTVRMLPRSAARHEPARRPRAPARRPLAGLPAAGAARSVRDRRVRSGGRAHAGLPLGLLRGTRRGRHRLLLGRGHRFPHP
jgi:amino acid transporter